MALGFTRLNDNCSNTNTDTPSLSVTVTAGELLIIAAVSRTATTAATITSITDNSSGGLGSYTSLDANMNGVFQASGPCRLLVRQVPVISSGTYSITFTYGTTTVTSNSMAAMAVTGYHATTPFPSASVQANGNSNTPASGTHSALGATANRRILVVGSQLTSGGGTVESGSWTEVCDPTAASEGNHVWIGVTNSDTDDTTPTMTLGASVQWRAASIEIAAAAGGFQSAWGHRANQIILANR